MKFIIYGAGKILKKNEKYVPWEDVVAVVDKSEVLYGKQICGKNILNPQIIETLEYDYIAIFTDDYFSEIKELLIGEFYINVSKIVSYTVFLPNYFFWSINAKELTKNFMKKSNGVILDTDDVGYSRYRTKLDNNSIVYNLVGIRNEQSKQFYSPNSTGKYEAVLLWENFEKNISLKSLYRCNANKILWTIPHSYLLNSLFRKQFEWLSRFYDYKQYLFLNEIVFTFEKRKIMDELNCRIYQVSHKKYNCIQNDIYKVVHVGSDDFEADYYDNAGCDNIAEYNDRINECTALYWIWKNTKSDYVGLIHYRRWFFNNNVKDRSNLLSKDNIRAALKHSRTIILPELTRMDISILDNIKMSVGEDVCVGALPIVKRIIERKQSKYTESFERVLRENVMYRGNMFVAPWEVFDSYCKWLFSFIIDVAKEIDVSKYTQQQKRVAGYFAEIMLTVWINHQDVDTVEFPISNI